MNLVAFMQEQKRIFGVCPCCGDLFRLSEAVLFTKSLPPRTPFDELDDERRKVDRAADRFEQKVAVLRDAALRRGQQEARKRLQSIARPFVDRKIDPQDVKVLFHPVEFVAFRGMTNGTVTSVALIDRPTVSREHEAVQNSVAQAVERGRYEWKVLRIDSDGHVDQDRTTTAERASVSPSQTTG